MKYRLSIIASLALFVLTIGTAQVCPPTNAGRYYTSGINSFNSGLYNTVGYGSNLNTLSYSFANIVNEGYRTGKLTRNEIWTLENDYNRLDREIRWAYSDGRVSFHERSMIDLYLRRLERNISKQWNNDSQRVG